MELLHGKAIEGGRPLTEAELETLARDQLEVLRQSFSAKPRAEKTDDVLSLRLAEELRLVSRMLELVENRVSPAAAKEIETAEDAIDDLADIVEAEDPCDALENVGSDLARRITRRSLDGSGGPCDNRRPSILRKPA